MILDELENVYGAFDDDVKTWIKDNLQYFTESEKVNYLKNLENACRKNNQKPDIKTLSAVLTKTTGKQSKLYFWAVCSECGGEYDYNLPMCPHCYKKGYECRVRAVKTSDLNPGPSVIKYNKTYIGDGRDRNCYSCSENEMSWCRNFGNENWECREYRDCACNACCSKMKFENRKRAEQNKQVKVSYAKPLARMA